MKIKQTGTYESIFTKQREKKRATKLRSYALLFTFLCMCLVIILLVSKGVSEKGIALMQALGTVDYKNGGKVFNETKVNASLKAHSLILRDIKMHNATRFFRNQPAWGQNTDSLYQSTPLDNLRTAKMPEDEIKDTVLRWESEFLSAVN